MIRNVLYQFRNNNSLELKIGAVIISVIIMTGLIMLFPHFFRSTYIVTIVNKRVIRHDNTDKYLIYAQMEDGNIKVFEDTNSLLEFKLDSEDVYLGLRVNRRYEVKTYGLRIPLLSAYENIINSQLQNY